ncbi:WcaI family glycosyltransferase [Bradyrhizobium sp. Gha]|uniref:WcaI family glycosyltransferase n=1 Tax=Bradyrhizobium sp. Gha TaxID=1855318 RepID=UPI0008EB635F|nr:WcaI family glycosyltransferase [Bradyrhizobium sp. Gha]SFI08678.1 colanic acid biosynthesis glycosyl transferase WcaI [Bradyrhizobium sp. Gha]
MKILAYGLNYAPELTGIGKYSSELCEWLAGRGHTIEVVTAHPYYPTWKLAKGYDNRSYQHEVRNRVNVHHCPIHLPRSLPTGKSGRILSHASFAASSIPKLLSSAHRLKPDILFAVTPSFLIAPAALAVARIAGTASWLHVQDFELDAAFELGMLEGNALRRTAMSMESMILRRFDRVSTISPRMMDRLRDKGVTPQKSVEFRNWVDTDFIKPADRMTDLRAQLGLTDRHVIALYSGSIAAKQGIESLAEAAVELKDRAPDIVFVFCGGGALLNHLVELASALPNVRFLDLQPNERMPELLATADIHLIPQRAQVADLMLPSKLAPILASGRPAVAMAEAGTQLASEIEGAGIAVSPSNPQSLSNAILRLAGDDQMRTQMGKQGRVFASERWRKESILSSLETRFDELISSRHCHD